MDDDEREFHESKKDFYMNTILQQADLVLSKTRDYISNMANISNMLYIAYIAKYGKDSLNWVGFYIARRIKDNDIDSTSRVLSLGPFCGKPAVPLINPEDGVCGRGYRMNETQVISDVHDCSYHISCDPQSKSEIVIPIRVLQDDIKEEGGDMVVGVLDIDSPNIDTFDDEDGVYLSKVCEMLYNASDWPSLDISHAIVYNPSEQITVCDLH